MVPYLFEESLGLLLRRHGEGRIGWDRCRPAFHLLGQGRFLEVVQLAWSLPLSLRPEALCEAESIALHQAGCLREAQIANQAGLEEHPSSFRLWMERFHLSMATGPQETPENRWKWLKGF